MTTQESASVPTTSEQWEKTQAAVRSFSASVTEVPAITNDEEQTAAGDLLRGVVARRRGLEADRKKVTVPLDKAKRAVMDLFRQVDGPLAMIDKKLREGMGKYSTEKAARAVRAQAEMDRLTRERAEEEQLEEAERLELQGRTEEAETAIAPATIERAAQDRQMHISKKPTKVEGISNRTQGHWEVTDPDLLPRKYLVPDTTKIAQVCKVMKKDHDIPGVRYWETSEVSVRS